MLLVCLVMYDMGSWHMTLALRFDITPSSSRFSSQVAKQNYEAISLPSYQKTLRLMGNEEIAALMSSNEKVLSTCIMMVTRILLSIFEIRQIIQVLFTTWGMNVA